MNWMKSEVRNFIGNGKTPPKYKVIIESNLVGNETMTKQQWKDFFLGLGKMRRIRNHIHYSIRIVGNFIPFMKQLWKDLGEKVSFSSDIKDKL